MATVTRDLITWAHEWGAELLSEGAGAGLSPDEVVLVMALANRFVLDAHPNLHRVQALVGQANDVANRSGAFT